MLTPEEIINQLKPCSYRYNDIIPLGDKLNFGFLAQDLLETFGEDFNFVQKNQETNYYTVNYFQFIAPLVSVVKSQQEQIELLKKEIEELKGKL